MNLSTHAIAEILAQFGLTCAQVTRFYDTSRGAEDQRYHYILDDRYVLKIASARSVWESRLQEISRLIERYRSIGVYCPQLLPTQEGPLSCTREIGGAAYTCYVEEYAVFPHYPEGVEPDRREVVAHLGALAAGYSGVDLSETRSMWSLIDLAPLDEEVDEKQENCNALVQSLLDVGLPELAGAVDACNQALRAVIQAHYKRLPRCVYQGDLNSSNELQQDGHFRGLIDFNMSGTEVNINCFVNETNWFPETKELDVMTAAELLQTMEQKQRELLDIIFAQYPLNDLERMLLPYYQKITDLFQYPNVCQVRKWLKEESRREKAAALIRALADRSL